MAEAKRDDNRVTTAIAWNADDSVAENLQCATASSRLLLDITTVTDYTPGTVAMARDDNRCPVACAVTDDSNETVTPLTVDSVNGYLFVDIEPTWL